LNDLLKKVSIATGTVQTVQSVFSNDIWAFL